MYNRRSSFQVLLSVAAIFAASAGPTIAFAQSSDRPWMNPGLPPEERAELVLKQMTLDGKKTHQIGIPIHWGFRGIQEDAGKTHLTLTNGLSPAVVDPNANTPEFKGFMVKVEKA